jgi:hypothetical protein
MINRKVFITAILTDAITSTNPSFLRIRGETPFPKKHLESSHFTNDLKREAVPRRACIDQGSIYSIFPGERVECSPKLCLNPRGLHFHLPTKPKLTKRPNHWIIKQMQSFVVNPTKHVPHCRVSQTPRRILYFNNRRKRGKKLSLIAITSTVFSVVNELGHDKSLIVKFQEIHIYISATLPKQCFVTSWNSPEWKLVIIAGSSVAWLCFQLYAKLLRPNMKKLFWWKVQSPNNWMRMSISTWEKGESRRVCIDQGT